MIASLDVIPNEVLEAILRQCSAKDFASTCLVSPHLIGVATSLLFHSFDVNTSCQRYLHLSEIADSTKPRVCVLTLNYLVEVNDKVKENTAETNFG